MELSKINRFYKLFLVVCLTAISKLTLANCLNQSEFKISEHFLDLARKHRTNGKIEMSKVYFEKATYFNSSEAFNALGEIFLRGEFKSEINYKKAEKYFKKGALLNNENCLYNLAFMAQFGFIKIDPLIKEKFLSISSLFGETKSILSLANKYQYGYGTQKSCESANFYFNLVGKKLKEEEKTAFNSIKFYPTRLNSKISKGNLEKEMLDLIKIQAEGGDNVQQHQLASILIKPSKILNIQKDEKKAFSFFEKAAKLGNSNSLIGLSEFYLNGIHVMKDIKKGIELLKKAALLKNVEANNRLAKLFIYNITKEINLTEAKKYISYSVSENNIEGMFLFSEMEDLENKKTEKGQNMLQVAATNGHIPALIKMAEKYSTSPSIANSCEASVQLLKIAAKHISAVYTDFDLALARYATGDYHHSLLLYMSLAWQGFKEAQFNSGFIIDQKRKFLSNFGKNIEMADFEEKFGKNDKKNGNKNNNKNGNNFDNNLDENALFKEVLMPNREILGENFLKNIINNFLKISEKNNNKISAENPTENSAENPTKNSAENPTKNSAENPTKNSAENPTENSAENPIKNSAENPTKNSAENPTENSAENPTENSAENPTKKSAEKIIKKHANFSANNFTIIYSENFENSNIDSLINSAAEYFKNIIENFGGDFRQNISKDFAENLAKKQSENYAENNGDNVKKESPKNKKYKNGQKNNKIINENFKNKSQNSITKFKNSTIDLNNSVNKNKTQNLGNNLGNAKNLDTKLDKNQNFTEIVENLGKNLVENSTKSLPAVKLTKKQPVAIENLLKSLQKFDKNNKIPKNLVDIPPFGLFSDPFKNSNYYFYSLASDQGDPVAKRKLGDFHYDNESALAEALLYSHQSFYLFRVFSAEDEFNGGKKRLLVSYELYKDASVANDAQSSFNMALMLHYGIGVEQDFEKAKECYLLSLQQENSSFYIVKASIFLLDFQRRFSRFVRNFYFLFEKIEIISIGILTSIICVLISLKLLKLYFREE